MRVLHSSLLALEPLLKSWSESTIAETLTSLGFETEQIAAGVFDVAFTPNRGDAMSALGLARELRAWIYRNRNTGGQPLVLTETGLTAAIPVSQSFSLVVKSPNAVPVYEAIVVENIHVGESPAWLKKAVTALGWRPINNVVDLTNYLMDQFGQPLHAFDFDAILGTTITLRPAKEGETITTLDGVDRTLSDGTLVLEDRESIIDLPGVIGGKNSEVTAKTTTVLLQAAVFDRSAIRATTNAMGIRTQAAIRYERGVDTAIARAVLDEAIRLMKKAEFGSATAIARIQSAVHEPEAISIRYRIDQGNSLLGIQVSPETVKKLLERIGCVVREDRHGLVITPPTWRYDITVWQDLAEEVARFIGIDESLPATALPIVESNELDRSNIEWAEGLKDRLVEIGMNEVMTYSFTSRRLLDAFAMPVVGELTNAVNQELAYLRPSMMPNLADVVAKNSVIDPIMIFEVGHVFTRTDEEVRLGVALAGSAPKTDEWMVRFADAIGLDSSEVSRVATATNLTKEVRDLLKIRKERVTLLEFRLQDLQSARRIPRAFQLPNATVTYRPISRFPAAIRDVSIIVSDSIEATEVAAAIRNSSQAIESVQLFDEFISEKFGLHKKSLAFHIRYADAARTLTDTEVEALHTLVLELLERSFQAILR